MKIAIAQLNPTVGDLAGNAAQILAAAQQAQSADLLLTTELSLCGYPPRDLLMQPEFIESMARQLDGLAQQLPPEMAVLVGTVVPNGRAATIGGKPLFNATALLRSGQVEALFYKRLLPTYDVFDEDRYFEPGTQSTWFELRDREQTVRIGVTICEDLWNDEGFWGKRNYTVNPIAELCEQQVNLIVNLSGSPYCVGKQQLRESMLQHAALHYQQPILYANQVGGNDDLIFDGNSVGFDRQGNLICRGKSFATDLIFVDFEPLTQMTAAATAIAPLPESDHAEIWAALVLGLRDYVQKCKFSKVVLGLSGGIDSALVAAIAAAAVGANNVLGILMPSPYSSDHSVSDALALAKNLGIATQILPIGDMMQSFDRTLAELFAGTEFGIAEENLQSRIRGSLLMAVSNKLGHLLISTGNKSEMAVGYCTLYGDMNGGLAAIADLPKTRVYALCDWLNRSEEIIPQNILTKPPSAELKPGQVDQDSLPPYEVLDDILHRLIELHQSPAEIIAAGQTAATVDRIAKLVKLAEFKRKQAPPGLKVTDRAFGTGWRMPIANRWLPSSQVPQPIAKPIPKIPMTAV